MFTKSRRSSRMLAVVLAAGAFGASGLTTGVAAALPQGSSPANAGSAGYADSGAMSGSDVTYEDWRYVYTLTEDEHSLVCGNFQGTISYSDGFTVNCANGDVDFTEPPAGAQS